MGVRKDSTVCDAKTCRKVGSAKQRACVQKHSDLQYMAILAKRVKTCPGCEEMFVGKGRAKWCNKKSCQIERRRIAKRARFATPEGHAKVLKNQRDKRDRDRKKIAPNGVIVCGVTGATDAVEVDHKIPKSLGGTDDSTNLTLLAGWLNACKK